MGFYKMKTDLYKCDIELNEYNNLKLYKKPLYSLSKNNNFVCIGDYTELLQIHKRLKDLLKYAYINNKNTNIIFTHNDDTFFIKNKKHNKTINLPNEQVYKLSANIGKFIYSKMIKKDKN